MPADIAGRVYLAALGSADLADAFGDGYETATEPPAVSELFRSLADTHVWATRETDVLADLDRGDYVLFHRNWGVRSVGQVWSTTADSDDVARLTDVEEPAGEWGVVTLTNVQPALDHVSLLSLDAGDALGESSLYRFDDAVAASLQDRFTTPARFVEETVENPLAFDVPPGGTPPDRRPDPPDDGGGMVAFDDLSLDAHVDALDGVRTLAWRVLALGAFMLAATLAVVQRYRPADGNPFTLTPPVSAGVAAVCVGAALAAGVVVHGALSPRPGLARFTREHAGATRRAGRRESSGDSTVHVADTVEAYCAHLHRQTRRLGFAAAGATVAILVGCVYVAYGLGAQVSPAVEPLSVVALAGFPLLVVATALLAVRRYARRLLPDVPGLGGGRSRPGLSLAGRLDALRRRLSSLTGRFR
ncbi:hypothetical protein HALDL1_12325 [Halobacterium sp. DL1]|jgi:hypothetical protein|nr:hypothetical protein HALDL1_12325 [Halobacterium sp. DL1]